MSDPRAESAASGQLLRQCSVEWRRQLGQVVGPVEQLAAAHPEPGRTAPRAGTARPTRSTAPVGLIYIARRLGPTSSASG